MTTPTASVRSAILLALGLAAPTAAGASGCADRGRYEVCADSEVDYATCQGEIALPEPGDPVSWLEEVCFEGSEGCDPCDVEAITGAALEQIEARCTVTEIDRVILLCGPDPESEGCCYKVQVEGDLSCATPGRPLLAAGGSPRVASLRPGRAWLRDLDELGQLCRPRDPAVVAQLRRRWLESARYEHASVAAFARVSLQLLALGAPPSLVRAARRAMADEIRHAQLGFSLAAAYGGGEALAAGPLAVEGSVAAGMDLESALREAIFDGALGEGAAAIEALEGADACEDPVLGPRLRALAEDEQRHALLAYRTVQWALAAHPRRARAIVDACLREGQRRAGVAAELGIDGGGQDLRRYGLLGVRRRARIQRETWTEVVAPVLAAMLAEARPLLVAGAPP